MRLTTKPRVSAPSHVSFGTSNTYLVSSSDAGSTFRVVVTASNVAGRASATSVATAVVPVPVRCVVPRLKGKTVAKARTLLRRAHCALGRVSYARSRVRRGLIVSQRPGAGAARLRGTKVKVVVSLGRRR
jgi:beta-lactam-binding protein with PASTA domain